MSSKCLAKVFHNGQLLLLISKKDITFVKTSYMGEQNMVNETLGSRLKRSRLQKSYSLRFVEENTEVSNAYLSQLENDKIKKPSANILHKLADFYKDDFNTLLSLAGIVEIETASNKSFGEYVFSKENLTKEEEEELIKYLKFMRLRNENKL